MSKLPAEIKKIIRADVADAKKTRWKIIGVAGMDTATLMIHDPCYSLPYGPKSGEKDFEITDRKAVYDTMKKDGVEGHFGQINFLRGHAGAGVIIHSPHGDGSVTIYGKLDAKNRVRAVFFSFDGDEPS